MAERPPRFSNADIIWAVLVFAIALAVRVLYLSYWVQSPYFAVPLLDEQYHHEWALRVAQGLGYEAKAYFRAPGYPYFLALIYRLLGESPREEMLALMPRVVQAVLGSLSALFTFFLTFTFFKRTVAIVAGVVAALYPVMVFFDGELLLPTLLVFLNCLFALALVKALRSRKSLWWLACGIAGGLSAITRPNILMPMMAIGLYLLWNYRRDWRRMIASALLYAAGTLLAILPVTIRNRVVAGDWVLIASQGGIVLYAGNGPEADGFTPRQASLYSRFETYQDTFEQYARVDAEKALGRPLKPSEISRYWSQRTKQSIADNPLHFLRLLVRKSVGWWTRVEVRNNKTVEFALQYAPPLLWLHRVLNFALIGPLAFVGIFWAWRRRPETRPIVLLVLVYQASFLPFFVCDRYRVPMLPFMVFFAAWTPFAFAEAIRAGRHRVVAAGLAGLIGASALVWIDWFHQDPQPIAEDYYMVAIAHEKKGELAEAKTALEEAIAEDPAHFNALHNLGRLYMQQGGLTQAQVLFEKSIEVFPRFSTAWNSLGAVLMAQGNTAQAQQAFETCLELDEGHALAHMNLSKLLQSKGLDQQAQAHRRRAYEIAPSLQREESR